MSCPLFILSSGSRRGGGGGVRILISEAEEEGVLNSETERTWI